ncbi:proline-rich protein 2-like [Nematolebias whitei]|uniref:proline-rich protein 2-like n=1 Tax=Nematolebias whitei TaxID=451745 RepID=UPI001898FCD2|nr:proline-rich protein 2-like [Nematolebias whitei]
MTTESTPQPPQRDRPVHHSNTHNESESTPCKGGHMPNTPRHPRASSAEPPKQEPPIHAPQPRPPTKHQTAATARLNPPVPSHGPSPLPPTVSPPPPPPWQRTQSPPAHQGTPGQHAPAQDPDNIPAKTQDPLAKPGPRPRSDTPPEPRTRTHPKPTQEQPGHQASNLRPRTDTPPPPQSTTMPHGTKSKEFTHLHYVLELIKEAQRDWSDMEVQAVSRLM